MRTIEDDLADAVELIREGRKFDNQTVIDSNKFASFRRRVDAFSRRFHHSNDPSEEYDTPERVAHRKFIEGLFHNE